MYQSRERFPTSKLVGPSRCHCVRILEVTSALYFNPRTDSDIPRNRGATRLPKFMQTLDDLIYRDLEKLAKKRGITIQELIRAVIVPEWVTVHEGDGPKEVSGKSASSWR